MEATKEVFSTQQGTVKASATDLPGNDGTRHHYKISHQPSFAGPVIDLGVIKFQEGNPNEVGVNGVFDIALLSVVADHIEGFSTSGRFNSNENRQAAWHVRQALAWLANRQEI